MIEPILSQYNDDRQDTIEDFANFSASAEKASFDDDGPSREGYQEAWESIQENLERQQHEQLNEYRFNANNTLFNQLQQRDENEIADLFAQGMELYRQGKVNAAIDSFEACVQHERALYESNSEANTDSWRMLGVCHADNDEDKKAILCLNNAIDCDPYNLDALLALGTYSYSVFRLFSMCSENIFSCF